MGLFNRLFSKEGNARSTSQEAAGQTEASVDAVAAIDAVPDADALAAAQSSEPEQSAECTPLSPYAHIIDADWLSEEQAIATVRELEDQEALEEIAFTARMSTIRLEATCRLTDREKMVEALGCNTLVMGTDSPAQAENAVRQLPGSASQDALAAIAQTAPLESVRIEAVKKIADQHVLLEIALNKPAGIKRSSRIGSVRSAAAKKITDPALVKRLALETDNVNHIGDNLERLGQNDLADIAYNAKDPAVRREAAELISDETALADIAIADEEIAPFAVNGIEDPVLLRHVFDAASNEQVKSSAIFQAGGYLCKECGTAIWPEATGPAPCVCPNCGAENHHWVVEGNVTDYRDYSAGEHWDRCSRCGTIANRRTVNTM